ncbi:membrane lipoprotein lipid attachment site-containing protein [Lysinibacillus sp. FSL L8-0312]|uniref:membrane lipoprotein lipid attachment site-containing protein n=1 Tax=Lysinibacillus sp. FSL L8-0312 TaxID=2921521 RepID=UPI0030FD188C
MNKIVLPILLVIILTGCNVFPTSVHKQPEGKVIFDDEHYTMISSNYEWKNGDYEVSLKGSSDISEIADNFETLEVEKGDILKFKIDKNPISINATKMNEDGTIENVEIKDEKITMPSKEGYYISELNTLWDKGKETFVFDVNVK